MCSPFEGAIRQYVRGQLAGEDLRRLQMHFQLCGVCRHQANVLRWRSMESGFSDILSVAEPAQSPLPETHARKANPAPPPAKQPPMSMLRALAIGATAGLALTLLLASFVPSVFSIERSQSNIEFRHLNGRVPQDPKPASNKTRRAAKARHAEPITMKLLTDDPDIVIHWTVE